MINIRKTMSNKDSKRYYLSILKDLKNSLLPNSSVLLHLIDSSKRLLIQEDSVVHITFSDPNSELKIYGDIHGQYYDLISTFQEIDIKSYNVFLGDYIDRGLNSIETIVFILLLKLISPTKIVILRGNHEFEDITAFYGFKNECILKYDVYLYEKFMDLFKYFSVCCIIETRKIVSQNPNKSESKKFFCVHGGIANKEGLIDEIAKSDRTRPNKYIMDLFWSDPIETGEGYISNPRGAGVLYGEDTVLEFLEKNKFDYMVRSHQLVMDGFKKYFKDKLLLVWSAPNYGYRQGNKASYIKIDINSQEDYEVVFYDKVEIQFKNNLPPNRSTNDYYLLNE